MPKHGNKHDLIHFVTSGDAEEEPHINGSQGSMEA